LGQNEKIEPLNAFDDNDYFNLREGAASRQSSSHTYYDSSLVRDQGKNGYFPRKSPAKTIKIADDQHGTKYAEDTYIDMDLHQGAGHLKKSKNHPNLRPDPPGRTS
jgi:hypothetical protein